MSHLLSDPSVDVQKMAYDLLREAAKKRTEYLVIESGVNTEDAKIDLPVELVNLLQSTLDEEQGSVRALSLCVRISPPTIRTAVCLHARLDGCF